MYLVLLGDLNARKGNFGPSDQGRPPQAAYRLVRDGAISKEDSAARRGVVGRGPRVFGLRWFLAQDWVSKPCLHFRSLQKRQFQGKHQSIATLEGGMQLKMLRVFVVEHCLG